MMPSVHEYALLNIVTGCGPKWIKSEFVALMTSSISCPQRTLSSRFITKAFGKFVYLPGRNFIAILRTRDYNDLKIIERFSRVVQMIRHPIRHKRVIRAISAPQLYPILRMQPQAPIKYLHPDYLALDLTTSQRADAFCYHYNFLATRLSKGRIQQILFDELLLWQYSDAEHDSCISVKFSRLLDNEGELSLDYRLNSCAIYTIAFTFVTGSIFKVEDETMVFVTRIQGIKGDFSTIRSATKSLQDVSPPFALIAALEGFALALGVRALIGIPARRHIATGKQEGVNPRAYDDFFLALGAVRMADGGISMKVTEPGNLSPDYFHVALPLPEKPITEIKRGHRSRAHAKRRLRRHISDISYKAIKPLSASTDI